MLMMWKLSFNDPLLGLARVRWEGGIIGAFTGMCGLTPVGQTKKLFFNSMAPL